MAHLPPSELHRNREIYPSNRELLLLLLYEELNPESISCVGCDR